MKTYIVVETEKGLALRQQPEMKHPDELENGYSVSGGMKFRNKYQLQLYNEYKHTYNDHLTSLEIIDIHPEYQGHWKVGDLVSENDFEKDYADKDHACKTLCEWQCHSIAECKYVDETKIVAIPKAKKQEKESEVLLQIWQEIIDIVYDTERTGTGANKLIQYLQKYYHITKK